MVDISPEGAITAVWMSFRQPRKCRMDAEFPQKSNMSTCNYRLLVVDRPLAGCTCELGGRSSVPYNHGRAELNRLNPVA